MVRKHLVDTDAPNPLGSISLTEPHSPWVKDPILFWEALRLLSPGEGVSLHSSGGSKRTPGQ